MRYLKPSALNANPVRRSNERFISSDYGLPLGYQDPHGVIPLPPYRIPDIQPLRVTIANDDDLKGASNLTR
jgi:hypothetical protein